jgi:membrane protein implicated in regulation of membrane protease activity
MTDISFSTLETFFLICAVGGGLLVIIKFVLQLMGGGGLAGMEGGIDGHADSDAGFQALSLLGISSFFMMFGLSGLALARQNQAGSTLSTLGALVIGLASVWLIGKLFRQAMKLQSSGTLKTSEAIGCAGSVYLTIPQGGSGVVSLNVRNRLREFEAVSKDGRELPTGASVWAVGRQGNILVVELNQEV